MCSNMKNMTGIRTLRHLKVTTYHFINQHVLIVLVLVSVPAVFFHYQLSDSLIVEASTLFSDYDMTTAISCDYIK